MERNIWKILVWGTIAILLNSCRNETSIQSEQHSTSQNLKSNENYHSLVDTTETNTGKDTTNPGLPKVVVQNNFESAFEELNQMLLNKQPKDLKRAVFLVENTWSSGVIVYESYCGQISEIVSLMRTMIQNKGISNFKTAGNWAAHTYLCKPIEENRSQPYTYDFDDPYGDRDYTKTFVTKLLNTKKGTCHSLPLLYKILTDEFGGEVSHLAVAPNHLYIKHKDESNRWYNLELTNGHFSTDAWIISSSHIKSEAIANRIYMSALNQTESIAICITDLADAYINKYGYGHDDTFVLRCLNAALKANPVYIVVITEKANVLSQHLLKECKNRGIPHFKNAKENHDLRSQALELEALYKQIDDLGYEEMPMEQYSEWVTKMQSTASIHKQTSN